MCRALVLKVAFVLTVLVVAAAPVRAQWATPTIDGNIAPGEYGTNNSLANAGNTSQTWYMTWDANNLYVGIVNANLAEGAVIYVAGNPQNPPTCCSNPTAISPASTTTNRFRRVAFSCEIRDLCQRLATESIATLMATAAGLRRHRTTVIRDNASNGNTREVAIPWSAITGGAGIPSSFVFFGYLTSSGGYIYGQVPTDNNIGAFAGTSAIGDTVLLDY